MIIESKLNKPYDQYTIRSKVWLQCDYCGQTFERTKKNREKLNKIILKDSCGNANCKKQKQKDICLKKYGTENIFDSDTFKEKQKSFNLNRYGVENYFQSEDFKNKRKNTLNGKYGVDHPLQCEEIKDKQIKTCIDKYGVENYSQTEEFNSKIKNTYKENSGFDHPMLNPKVVNKRDNTCLEKYGKKNYMQTKQGQDKKSKTCIKKYGVSHTSKLKSNRLLAKQTCIDKYGVENYSQTEEWKMRYEKICLEKYGVPNPLCLQKNQKYGKTQNEIKSWLNDMGFCFNRNYSVLKNKELDLYDNNQTLAIEYCGLFWHNEKSPEPRCRTYHYNKYLNCLDQKVRLITIFEDEWKNKNSKCCNVLQSILNKTKKIYARKCEIKEIDKSQAYDFCKQYHLNDNPQSCNIAYGLFYENELVATMILGHHHRKGKDSDSIVLNRLCFKSGIQVIGGASKLFKKCTQWSKNNQYKKIISWSDNRWSQGNVYNALGFTLEKELGPDYSYVNVLKPYKRLSKQSFKSKKFGELTEKEWADQNGYARIWDCGKKRWVFDIN